MLSAQPQRPRLLVREEVRRGQESATSRWDPDQGLVVSTLNASDKVTFCIRQITEIGSPDRVCLVSLTRSNAPSSGGPQ